MTDLSDFARPPKSRHVREKARLGRPMGFTPWSNEDCTIILDHIRYKKLKKRKVQRKFGTEKFWHQRGSGGFKAFLFGASFPNFQNSNQCVSSCGVMHERFFFRSGTPRQSPKTPDCRKEKFAVEKEPPHSNDVQHKNSKLSHKDLRVKNKNKARDNNIFFVPIKQ